MPYWGILAAWCVRNCASVRQAYRACICAVTVKTIQDRAEGTRWCKKLIFLYMSYMYISRQIYNFLYMYRPSAPFSYIAHVLR